MRIWSLPKVMNSVAFNAASVAVPKYNRSGSFRVCVERQVVFREDRQGVGKKAFCGGGGVLRQRMVAMMVGVLGGE